MSESTGCVTAVSACAAAYLRAAEASGGMCPATAAAAPRSSASQMCAPSLYSSRQSINMSCNNELCSSTDTGVLNTWLLKAQAGRH